MKYFFLSLSILVFSVSGYCQCQYLTIDTTCITYTPNDGCSKGLNLDFINRCSSKSGWTPSNGTPEIIYAGVHEGYAPYYALMVADMNGGEGMFYPFKFIAGQTYKLTFDMLTTNTLGLLYVYAADSLVQHQDFCQGNTPTVRTKQIIGESTNYNTNNPDITFSFTANANYQQLWMFALFTSTMMDTQFEATVSTIQVCPVCNISASTGLSTSNNTTTLTWNAVTGASSYNIYVGDTHNGNLVNSVLTSNTSSVNFCPLGAGDNVSFNVIGVCANGGTGAQSNNYSYTYTPVSLAAPANLSFNSIPPFTVSWSPVTGATSYYYEWTGLAPINVAGTSISDPDAALENGNTYEVEVAATNGCVTGPYSSPALKVVVPPACSPAPSVANVEGGTYITLYAVSGASSYNVGFENSSHVLVYQVDNIGSIITTSGYQCTGVPAGSYYIVAQTKCTNGGTSVWGTPYYGGLQTVSSVIPKMASVVMKTEDTVSDNAAGILIYPVPSASKIYLIYTTDHTGNLDVTMLTTLGNTVLHSTFGMISGQNKYPLDISKLPNGVYFIKLIDGGKSYSRKVIVLK